jgi:hypothetical protein
MTYMTTPTTRADQLEELLDLYRQLGADDRAFLLDFARRAARRQAEELARMLGVLR